MKQLGMIAYKLDRATTPLDSWGTPEDIGAQTVQGPIHCAGAITLGGLDQPVFGGEYSASRGIYRVTYTFHEHATLVSGQVVLTDENTEQTVVYGPGDSWIIAKGTPVMWEIRSDEARKSFLAVTTDL